MTRVRKTIALRILSIKNLNAEEVEEERVMDISLLGKVEGCTSMTNK